MCVFVQKEEKARQERIADWDRHQEGIEQLPCVCMCTERGEGQAGENFRMGQTSEGHRTVVLCVYVYRKRRPGRRE